MMSPDLTLVSATLHLSLKLVRPNVQTETTMFIFAKYTFSYKIKQMSMKMRGLWRTPSRLFV